jgi:2-oxoglutarate dehydrogenase E2 component (dihydrolipoamide succinyltransferase)
MAVEIVVPNLGESVTEATVAIWLKKQGQAVAADEVVLELETDKATLEIPAPASGVLSEILVQEGEDVEVGATLGRIEESGEAAVAPAASEPKPAEAAAPEPAAEVAAPTEAPGATAAAPPGLDPAAVPRSGPGGTVTLEDLQSFFARASQDAVERSGPAVRKLIADHGLDPAEIAASGRDGRLTKEDVLSFLSQRAVPARARPEAAAARPAPAPPAASIEERREERVRMTRLRRTIAVRLKEAQNTAAILSTFNEADMSAVIELRQRYRETFEQKHGVRLGFMSFFVKAVVGALKEMLQVNASIDGDEIVYKYYYDIGMAVSTDAGLKVLVIRDADRKSFAELEREIADLAARARDGSLTLEEMEGGTFSITNGGVFGSLLSTPILNPPQSAILGLHKIEERPVVVDGEIVVRPMMYLAMSYDHRMIDGRESVTFLVRVKELIENPDRLMLEV